VNASETTGRELERVGDRSPGMHTGEPAYMAYSEEMRRLVGASIMPKDYEPHELYYVLELAATYNLDPFTREIQAVRFSRNAGSSAVQIVVGRDGLLAIAQRHPDYLGFRCEAFYENDETEMLVEPDIWPLPNGDHVYTRFRHRATTLKRGEKGRGKLLGAFAEVYRRGKVPADFVAYLEDYDKGSSSDRSPWLKMKDVMIEKVALATALRLAFRVSGLYLMEELSGSLPMPDAPADGSAEADSDYGPDPVIAQHLRNLFDHQGNRYLPAKRRLMLSGLDDEGRAELVARLEREILEQGGTPPARPDPGDVDEVVELDSSEVAEDDANGIEFGEPAPEPDGGPDDQGSLLRE
jgi:phage recombination protein Bet